jgi:proline racemase
MLNLDRLKQGFDSRYPEQYVTIDSHTQGEPTRLLINSDLDLPGNTIKEKREQFAERYDYLRLLLTREPRGQRDMFAAAVTEPVSPEAHFGLIYMDARRYPYLCGHGTIGAVTALIETGALHVEEGNNIISIDTPSGMLQAHTKVRNSRVESVGLDMVPSFVLQSGCSVEVPEFGTVPVDLVCVGGVFAMVSASSINIELTPANSKKLVALGMAIIEAANQQLSAYHPERPEVDTIDVAEFYQETGEAEGMGVVVYGEAHMDRSPCGTGTTAKIALLHHHNLLQPGQIYRNSSPLGTVFEGEIVQQLAVGSFGGIIARIRGNAVITGYHQFVVDPADPFPKGFLL